ncbi:MAG: ArsR family transcriptional regulator [candidate division WOR-3 bacterium]
MDVNGILSLLADSTRLKILKILKKGEKNVSKIVEGMKLSQPTVSQVALVPAGSSAQLPTARL